MVYFGFFITDDIFQPLYTNYTQYLIEDEIYSVGLGQKMAPQLIKEINFNCCIILFLVFSGKPVRIWKNKTSG